MNTLDRFKDTIQILPQEIEVWYVIPALRRAFALEMKEKGLKGVEIAKFLGVTEAAVSQYFSRARAVQFRFTPEIEKLITLSAHKVLKGESAMNEIQKIILSLRETKSICKFHHTLENLNTACTLCFHHGN